MLVMLALANLLAGLHNGIFLSIADETQLMVGYGSCLFGDGQTIDEQRILVEMKLADIKVLKAAKGLNAIESAGRYVAHAKKIALPAIAFRRITFHII